MAPEIITFADNAFEVEAAVIADGLGMTPFTLHEHIQAGRVKSVCERGFDEDVGRYRLTFFSENRRFRLVVDDQGRVLKRSAINFDARPLPRRLRRSGD